MEKGWLIGMPYDKWKKLKCGKVGRLPTSWSKLWSNGDSHCLELYDYIFGLDTDNHAMICSGVATSKPYITPDGWTVEILLHCMFKHQIICDQLLDSHLPFILKKVEGKDIDNIYCHIKNGDKGAGRKIRDLKRFRQKEIAFDNLVNVIRLSGCKSNDVIEVVKTLSKITNGYNSEEDLAEVKQLVDYIAYLLMVDEKTPNQWIEVWEMLLDSWKKFTTTLNGEEMKLLEKEMPCHFYAT